MRLPRVRISVRVLMLVLVALGCLFGWVAHRARVQREAVAAIRRAGGSVSYDWEWANGRRIPTAGPRWPRWLVERLGVDYFGTVVEANLYNARFSDAELVQLEGLTRLQVLDLRGTQVSDAGLVHLKGLTRLQELDLGRTRVSDAGLTRLARLTHLSDAAPPFHTGVAGRSEKPSTDAPEDEDRMDARSDARPLTGRKSAFVVPSGLAWLKSRLRDPVKGRRTGRIAVRPGGGRR